MAMPPHHPCADQGAPCGRVDARMGLPDYRKGMPKRRSDAQRHATPSCPLCLAWAGPGEPGPDPFARVHGRVYFRCSRCALIFLGAEAHLDPAEERARYETHRNAPDDAGYRRFLDRLATPLLERLPPGAEGLDYGSGPGPTLSVMLEERGMQMAIHDPFFAPDPSVLERRWDFITCTETVEHFFRPAEEFERFRQMLRPGGWLAVMTEWPPRVGDGDEASMAGEAGAGAAVGDGRSPGAVDRDRFREWYYIRDPTHVCFYPPATFRWIAERYGWRVDFPRRNVAIFRAASEVDPG